MSATRFRPPAVDESLALLTCPETLAVLRSMSDCCWACGVELADATSLPLTRVSEILSSLHAYGLVTTYKGRWLLDGQTVAEHCQALKTALR